MIRRNTYEVVQLWDEALRGLPNACKVRVNGHVFDVHRFGLPDGSYRFRGMRNGSPVTGARIRFTSTIADLAKWGRQ